MVGSLVKILWSLGFVRKHVSKANGLLAGLFCLPGLSCCYVYCWKVGQMRFRAGACPDLIGERPRFQTIFCQHFLLLCLFIFLKNIFLTSFLTRFFDSHAHDSKFQSS